MDSASVLAPTQVANVLACVNNIGTLSMKFARTTAQHDRTAAALIAVEAALANHQWIAVTAGLSALGLHVAAFNVAAAVTEGRRFLFEALASADDCERADITVPVARRRFRLLQGGRS